MHIPANIRISSQPLLGLEHNASEFNQKFLSGIGPVRLVFQRACFGAERVWEVVLMLGRVSCVGGDFGVLF